jgi:hypothetical protein
MQSIVGWVQLDGYESGCAVCTWNALAYEIWTFGDKYGAGYYGYLYAQKFAADIWMSVLAPCMASSSSSSSPSHHLDAAVRNGGVKIWKEMYCMEERKIPRRCFMLFLVESQVSILSSGECLEERHIYSIIYTCST